MLDYSVNTQFTYGMKKQGDTAADLIIVFVSKEDMAASGGERQWVHQQVDVALRGYYAKSVFKAKPQEIQLIPTLGLIAASHVAFIGVDSAPLSAGRLRDAAAAAAKAAVRVKAQHVDIQLRHDIVIGATGCEPKQAAQALTEGFLLGLYHRKPSKREEEARHEVSAVTWIPEDTLNAAESEALQEEWSAGIQRGVRFAEATAFARDLTNLPGNRLTPEALAEEAEKLAARLNMDCEIIDEWTAAEQGMGGLLGVGLGSANPPRMIVLHYQGAPDNDEVWGLVGKGITFDTGGISLKKADGMEEMISDMGGAAAVLGAMQIIGELKPAVNVVAVIPAAENMPSDRALKPGDVITTMSGRTIEIVNTDAEGRLVLADGLTTAIRRGATKLIDVATLTGAVMVALGDLITGAVTNDETLMQRVVQAGYRAGERIWPLPSDPYYRKQLNSDAADMKNSGGRYAGTITGGLFIGVFAEEKPWVHLDIGGTAFLNKERGWEPKGATGVMVRTLAELLT
ncbi:leucyl aminopeptidase [Paenibacillus abyssi]|uniref:Probable cytosol aminopeptidase n=1 Tax=Paenibacillus abyssi TaxID=1340531 RepID=A0A917FUR8_9BACL|nr:leucyl aminopeptidase [Paenibacillus abyssi]GGG04432.1 putative cytosol aminopeptidase [Paenibacillus abyssi]